MVYLEDLPREKGNFIVSIEKISRMGMVSIVYGEISEDSGLQLPLGSSTCVTDGSRKCVFHCMILMGIL